MSEPPAHDRDWAEPETVPYWFSARPEQPQCLVRQVGPPEGWRKRVWYEVAYCPSGRLSPPLWTRRTRSAYSIWPGPRPHTTDFHDVVQQVHRAWAEGNTGFVSYPTAAGP